MSLAPETIKDPEVRNIFNDLTKTLRRMATIERRTINSSRVTFLARKDQMQRVHGYMRRENILHEAEALRRLIAKGLEAENVID